MGVCEDDSYLFGSYWVSPRQSESESYTATQKQRESLSPRASTGRLQPREFSLITLAPSWAPVRQAA
jgi:hypothetical protein